MSASPNHGSLLDQLRSICEAHPYAPKVVFVPRVQLGRVVETSLALQHKGWVGLRCLIPRHYAEHLAEHEILASGRAGVSVRGKPFLAARIMEEVSDTDSFAGLPAPHHFADTIGTAVDTLRLGGVTVEAVRGRAARPEVSDAFQAIARCYVAYHEFLSEHGLYDDADVFQWAAERIRRGKAPEIDDTVCAVCDGTNLPERAYQMLCALQERAEAFYRVGISTREAPPPQAAAALFDDVPRPAVDESSDRKPTEPARFRRAVGAYNEVRAVFQDLLTDEVPFDEVKIAYTEGQPYLSIIADTADRLGIPISIGTGLPGRLTRTGQALRGFYEWIVEDFDVAVLIRLLRNGHLRLDRVMRQWEDLEIGLGAHEAATLLAARRYEPGRLGYRRALARAIDDKERRITQLEERGLDPERTQTDRDKLELLMRVLDKLAALAPRRATADEMARASQQFLERFGPVDSPPDAKSEEERTMEEAARAVIWQKLDALTKLPFTYEASGKRLAALLRGWVEEQYVRAEHPRPGVVHVLPLESAGYSSRSHSYAVGFDSDTLSTAVVEGAVLRDADRKALSASLEGGLPEQSSVADETFWRITQALRRQEGRTTLYTRVFDVGEGEERYPSSLFLQLERQASTHGVHESTGDDKVIGFLPGEDEAVFLTDSDAWLKAYRARLSQSSSPERTAREALRGPYPWLVEGAKARQARASEHFTTHDGLFAPGEYPELDFLGETYEGSRLSAGRLETFGETPYIYFLKYVLGVHPLDEPALDDEPWFNKRRRGTLLHRTFAAFMEALDGASPSDEHASLLFETLDAELHDEVQRHAPPNEAARRAARRQLRRAAHLFLQAEIERAVSHEPLHHEIGFGFGPYRRREGDFGAVEIDVGEGKRLPLRGRIDRVDRRSDGGLAIWDYKTGSMSDFDEGDPLKKGAKLQWMVYAYALEALTGETVSQSGYFFTSIDAMGERLVFSPDSHRKEAAEIIRTLARMAREGTFPMNPKARYVNRWKWEGYKRLFPDLEARSTELKQKDYSPDRPTPPFLE